MLIGGDSGGPLFDLSGKLVGIHSRVGQQAQVNMHVPLAEFVANWYGLINGEFIGEGPYAEKPEKGNGYLGLATNSSSEGGLIVTKVGLKSPAELAGIKNGDVLLKLNEVHLEKREQMQEMLKNLSAGDEVSFEIKRAGKLKTITFNLGER
jgi:serine protease Do